MLLKRTNRDKRKSRTNACPSSVQPVCQVLVEQLEERCLMSADPILDWNAVAIEVNRLSYSGNVANDQMGPTRSSRALAIVHIAMFDAWNSVQPRYTPYLVKAPQARNASGAAAVAQAAHDTLVAMYPSQQGLIDAQLADALDRIPNGVKENRGIAVGQFVAQQVLASRIGDGAEVSGMYTPDGQPGNHNVDPLNPGQGYLTPAWGEVTTFGIEDPAQIPTRPVPELSSMEYAQAYSQAKSLGAIDSSERTMDQTGIGLYWGYDVARGLGDPPRLYNQIARTIAEQERNQVHENARMFALINIAMADAGIHSWDVKYRDEFWRPVIAIREGDNDGNPDTVADPTWQPLGAPRTNPAAGETINFTPPFPAYTSGHATFGSAMFKTLANFYRTDDVHFSIPFNFVSDEFNGLSRDIYETIPGLVVDHVRALRPRHFDSFSQAAAENAASRIFLGIHWRFDAVEGVSAGNRIADYVFDHELRPLRSRAPMHIASVNFTSQIDAYLNGTYVETPEWICGKIMQMIVAPGSFHLSDMPDYSPVVEPLVQEVMTELMDSSRFRRMVHTLDQLADRPNPSANRLRLQRRLETQVRDVIFSSRTLIDNIAATM